MSEIAKGTRYFEEFDIVMTVVWRRLKDTNGGKNWRNVYKALTLLEFLVSPPSSPSHIMPCLEELAACQLTPWSISSVRLSLTQNGRVAGRWHTVTSE